MNKRRSDLAIMRKLIVLVKPLTGVMLTGIILGVLGFLCAIFLTILGGYGILKGILELPALHGLSGDGLFMPGGVISFVTGSWQKLFTVIFLFAVARGSLHYGEQYCNHYIAFRILAIIRHKVFAILRKLCPAKLEGRKRGISSPSLLRTSNS